MPLPPALTVVQSKLHRDYRARKSYEQSRQGKRHEYAKCRTSRTAQHAGGITATEITGECAHRQRRDHRDQPACTSRTQ